MSSPPKAKGEMKGGHLPAVKAGGMRIVQKHQGGGATEPVVDKDKEKKEENEEAESTGPPKPTVVVSGAVTKGDRDFTPAAAQVAHQKPTPCVEKLPPQHHINQHIHQPRK
ncbi:death-associated protein 1-like [Megalops cyprinoides]|uniref:death-associated protein 1-like n=1 Tax=Megalops cyprinoides TaxID=118141 RepID=UPI001863A230|nr:death-associated protein 1-like [Megalops cyprinoides]